MTLYGGGVPLQEIVARFGGSKDAIRRCARRAGVLRAPGRRPWRTFTEAEIATMSEMWDAGASQTAIARRFETTQVLISRVLQAAGYTSERRVGRLRREAHGSWKGGRNVTSGGYVQVMPRDDDSIGISMRTRMGYVMEHRLVMAHALGRPLIPDETVHHVSGDVADNRLENLQLRHGRHGKGTALVCLDCGSRNIGQTLLAGAIQD